MTRALFTLALCATLALPPLAGADEAKEAPAFAHDESPYALRLDVDIATLVLGGVLWAGTSFIGNTQAPFCGGTNTPPCDASGVNAFDKLALNHSSSAARTAADVISFVPIAYLA